MIITKVFDKLQETLASEVGNVCKTLSNIQALANKLYLNVSSK